MTDNSPALSERDEIELLLPWYVSGRLDLGDRARVEDWVARDQKLAQQLGMIAEDRAHTIVVNEAQRLPSTVSVHRTMHVVAPARSDFWTAAIERIRHILSAPSGRAVGYAAGVATVLLLAQSVWIGSLLLGGSAGRYQTASGTPTAIADGSFALVRFGDAVSIKDIAAALASLDMTIVDGPKPGGIFRLRIGSADMPEAARNTKIAALQRLPGLTRLVSPTK